jgi:hypothetical protein
VFYAQALADDGIKVKALAAEVLATNLNPRAAPAAATRPKQRRARSGSHAARRLARCPTARTLPDAGPTGQLFSWDGAVVPW